MTSTSPESADTSGQAQQDALEAAAAQAAALAQEAGEAASARQPPPASGPQPFELPAFDKLQVDKQAKAISLLADVNLNVKIELGRTRLSVEDVLRLSEGSVVELDKLAGDPVDVYVNERHVARGEVLVLNDNFCVRINEILAPVPTPIT